VIVVSRKLHIVLATMNQGELRHRLIRVMCSWYKCKANEMLVDITSGVSD
jgi:hypothetical protein